MLLVPTLYKRRMQQDTGYWMLVMSALLSVLQRFVGDMGLSI